MKTSFVVLVLLGAVDLESRHAAVSGAQLERYFPHHSWERVNPAEFVRSLNQEVEAEKQQQKKGAAADSLNQKQQKKQKKDDSMIQQEQDEGQFTAHEMAIQLKETMQSTLAEMGVDYKSHEDTQNDLIQVTADDFDNYDHLNENHRSSKKALNGDEKDELNKQKVAHISRMEQKLTERINTLLNSSHRTDGDEGELEDVLLEVKPIKKLGAQLVQAHEKVKGASEVKKSQGQTFSQLDEAFEGLKNLVDKRKQMLAQLTEQRSHHHHHGNRDAEEERELMEAAPRDSIPRHAQKQAPHTHMSQQIDMDKFQKKFADKAEERGAKMQDKLQAAPRPQQMERRQALQPAGHPGAMPPRSEPMQQSSEGPIKPHGIPDPRDRFSIPSNELRKEKKDELDKIVDEETQDKTEKELNTISRSAKNIIDSNKKQIRDVAQKYSKQERKDILTRQETHSKLKKLNKHDKMEKDLEEQQEVDNTIKRADQITTAIKDFENKKFSKEVVAEAEDDMITKEDQANQQLQKQFKKELDKEDLHARKRNHKDQEVRDHQGWNRPEKFVYPEDAKKMEKKAKQAVFQEPTSLVENSVKIQEDADEGDQQDNKTEEQEEEKGESEEKSDEKDTATTEQTEKEKSSEDDKEQSEDDKSEEPATKPAEKTTKKKSSAAQIKNKESDESTAATKQKPSSKKAKVNSDADENDKNDEVQEKEFNSFAQHAMDALSEAKKLEAEFDDLQKDD